MSKEIYVSTSNGNDSNPGTQSQPLKKIGTAVARAVPGDTILIEAGTYRESVVVSQVGTSARPLTIKALTGTRPIVDISGMFPLGFKSAVEINGSYIHLEGLEIISPQGRSLLVRESSYITVRNCDVHTCRVSGVFVSASNNVTVDSCLVHNCSLNAFEPDLAYVSSALKVGKASDNIVIRNNRVFENYAEGIIFGGGGQYCVIEGNVVYDNRHVGIYVVRSRDTVVNGNLVYHTGRTEYLHELGKRSAGIVKLDEGSDEGRPWTSKNLLISNNIVVGCEPGFRTGNQPGGDLVDVTISHNTFVNNIMAIQPHPSRAEANSNVIIENNLVVSSEPGSMTNNINSPGITWRNNLWSDHPGENVYDPTTDVLFTGNLASLLASPNAPVEPGTVRAESYMLVAGSAAIGRARPGVVVKDHFGNNRDQNPDIGAHERGAAAAAVVEETPPPVVEASGGVVEGLSVLPDDFHRFLLVSAAGEASSEVIAYGLQFPDGRVILAWSDAPEHLIHYDALGQLETAYLSDGATRLTWLDNV